MHRRPPHLRGHLIGTKHQPGILRGLDPESGCPGGPRVCGELSVDWQGLGISVDAVVHVEPIDGGGSEVVTGSHPPKLETELVVTEMLVVSEAVEDGRGAAIDLLDGESRLSMMTLRVPPL